MKMCKPVNTGTIVIFAWAVVGITTGDTMWFIPVALMALFNLFYEPVAKRIRGGE